MPSDVCPALSSACCSLPISFGAASCVVLAEPGWASVSGRRRRHVRHRDRGEPWRYCVALLQNVVLRWLSHQLHNTGNVKPCAALAQYDLSTSTFSPDGRVFQTDYAQKAVDNSGRAGLLLWLATRKGKLILKGCVSICKVMEVRSVRAGR